MKSTLVIKELERMSPDELGRELRLKQAEAAAQRMGLEMQKDKDSAKYRTLRRDIARMTMVLDAMRAKGAAAPAKTEDKTASKVEKNPVQDSGSAKKKTAKTSTMKKKSA